MLVQVLCDNLNSWMVPYAISLVSQIEEMGHEARLIHRHKDVVSGDILCLLSCERLFKRLELNKSNIVVHSSDLPRGKGWSPLSWEIVKGNNLITHSLFEAGSGVDEGDIYLTSETIFDGHELLDEMKHHQGLAINKLIISYIDAYPRIVGKPQIGDSTYYRKRRPEDSELDVNKTLAEQFDLLRICDNNRYPAFFNIRGHKYILRITKYKDENS